MLFISSIITIFFFASTLELKIEERKGLHMHRQDIKTMLKDLPASQNTQDIKCRKASSIKCSSGQGGNTKMSCIYCANLVETIDKIMLVMLLQYLSYVSKSKYCHILIPNLCICFEIRCIRSPCAITFNAWPINPT